MVSGVSASNRQHLAWKASALPIELTPLTILSARIFSAPATSGGKLQQDKQKAPCNKNLVEQVGFEPTMDFRRRIMRPLPATNTASVPNL